MLNQDQKNFYDDNGYLMVENVLSKEQLTTMQNITYNWIESSKSVTESDSFFDLDEGHSKNSHFLIGCLGCPLKVEIAFPANYPQDL